MAHDDLLFNKIEDLFEEKLTEKLDPISKELERQGKDISELRKGQDKLRNGQDQLRNEQDQQGKDIAEMKTVQKKQSRTISRAQKDIKLILSYHDEMHIFLRERIEALEKKVNHN